MLNTAQQLAVHATGHCLITACPGSGKTTVLKYRAAYLLRDPKARVLGVTFSSESAKDLAAKIHEEVPAAGPRVICGTFHALCKRQLERAGQRFRLINEIQQTELLRRAFVDACDDDGADFEACVTFIEDTKSRVEPMLHPAHEDVRVRVYERYQALLARMGAYDFSDLLRLAVRGMRIPPGSPGHVDPYSITHMLVDEFQDTDEVQFAWMKEHIARRVLVTVVGDDDQSIFSFRAALAYKGMDNFRVLTQATHISLDTSYRFPKEIMEPAARLIVHNTERIPKALVTANRARGTVRVVGCDSTKSQMLAVVRAIRSSGDPGGWAVLARTNAQLENLEHMMPADMNVVRHGGRSFWELNAPALFLLLARGVACHDMACLDHVLRATGIAEGELAKLHQTYQSRRPGAVQRFAADKKRGPLTSPIERLRKYIKESWYPDLKTNPRGVLTGFAYFLKTYIPASWHARSRDAVKRDADRFDACAISFNKLHGPIALRLQAILEKRDVREAANLMTMHASKGLQFPHVWVIGCEDGVVPSQRGILEEERRLFYVAMTRAQQDLTVSYVRGEKSKPSPFLHEARLFAASAA